MQYDLHPRLKKFLLKSEEDAPWTALMRDVAKGFFDFMRSLFVVGALKFVSDKAKDDFLTGIYYVSLVVLILLASTYIFSWNVKLFAHLPWRRLGEGLDLLLNLVLALVLFALSFYVVDTAVDAVVKTYS